MIVREDKRFCRSQGRLRTPVLGILCLLVSVGFLWLATRRQPPAEPVRGGAIPGATHPTSESQASAADVPAAPPAVSEPKPYRPETVLVKANPAWAGDREKQRAEVRLVLEELRQIYGHVGELSLEESRRLLVQRRKAEEALLERLAGLGPGGARVIQESFTPGLEVRAQLLLTRALGLLDDPEVARVAGEPLAAGGSFSLRKELVTSLGQRFDDVGATEALRRTLSGDEDPQMRYAAAQALSGRSAAVEALVQRIESDGDKAVRLEAIRAVGLTGSDAGQAALVAVARDGGQELTVRQTAIQELRRSYGTKARAALEQLGESADLEIRASAEKALLMIDGKPGAPAVSALPRP